jgi:predicted  nucleic acid-binding Zn-ribbon protein
VGDAHPILEVQRLDLEADALRARRAALGQRAACAAREAELRDVAARRADAEARRGALAAEERRVEERVAELAAKAREVEGRLYSGEVKALKELEGLQQELGGWQRRRADEEAVELALLEQDEGIAAELAELGARGAALEAELDALGASLAAAEVEIDAELARLAETRGRAAGSLEGALLRRYDALRVAPPIRGRAAVQISDGACLGCSRALPIAFVAGLHGAPPGATALCPHCGRILAL